jgi:hypothetical protein
MLEFHLRGRQIAVELIIVEYARLAGAKSIKEVARFPEVVTLRVIDVPQRYHEAFCAKMNVTVASVVPILEFVGKNIGIRRARGRFGREKNYFLCFFKTGG